MQKHRSKDATKEMVLACVRHSNVGLTRTQIARCIQRGKTPYLIALLNEMVAEGYLIQEVVTFHNHVQGYVYTLGSHDG